MSDDAPAPEEEVKPKSGLIKLLVPFVIGVVCCSLGFALFLMLAGGKNSDAAVAPVDLPPVFVPFGDVVANLYEGRMTRYLRLNITLQVAGGTEETATVDVESHRAIMRNWVLGYLSSLQMEDIRGAAGQNRIRREIQNHFNDILSPDGVDVVQDILFEEFTVQ